MQYQMQNTRVTPQGTNIDMYHLLSGVIGVPPPKAQSGDDMRPGKSSVNTLAKKFRKSMRNWGRSGLHTMPDRIEDTICIWPITTGPIEDPRCWNF